MKLLPIQNAHVINIIIQTEFRNILGISRINERHHIIK